MKVQELYNASNDGVISGSDLQEFFMQEFGEYSISGNEDVDEETGKSLLMSHLSNQLKNSPSKSFEAYVFSMRIKYGLV